MLLLVVDLLKSVLLCFSFVEVSYVWISRHLKEENITC